MLPSDQAFKATFQAGTHGFRHSAHQSQGPACRRWVENLRGGALQVVAKQSEPVAHVRATVVGRCCPPSLTFWKPGLTDPRYDPEY